MRKCFKKAQRIALFLVTSIGCVGDIASVYAEEAPEVFTPVRPMGMGGAFTAVANDESSIWTNPAGVARIRKPRSRKIIGMTKIPGLSLGVNRESRSFYSGFKSSQEKNVEDVISSSGDMGDKPFWGRASLFPVMIFDLAPNNPAAFSLFSVTTIQMAVDADDASQAKMTAISDMGSTITVGISNFSRRLDVGVQVRPMFRYAYEDTVPSSIIVDKNELQRRLKDESNKSSAIAFDLGFSFTLADFWFPTLGLSILNAPTGCREGYLNPFTKTRQKVCGTKYTGSFGNEEALSTIDPTDIRVGVSILPRLGRKVALRFALDAHHLYLTDGTQYYGLPGLETSKMLHGGVELVTGNPLEISPFTLRVGANQGFYTFGFSLNFSMFSLDFATYGTDISSSATAEEDRRYVGGLSMVF